MGTRFTVGGIDFEALDYSVTEDSTGLALNDSSGGTGEVRVSVAKPSPEEIQNFPSPYPDARSLTPVAPGHLDDIEDFLYSIAGATPTVPYEIVDIDETREGVRKALRLTLAPYEKIVYWFPNGGARSRRSFRFGERLKDDSVQFFPSVPVLDPQSAGDVRLAMSVIIREGSKSDLSNRIRFNLTKVGDDSSYAQGLPGTDLNTEYVIRSEAMDVSAGPLIPYIVIASNAEGRIVLDIPLVGVFASKEPAPDPRDGIFSGFVSPSGYATEWESGSPGGLVTKRSLSPDPGSPWVRLLAPKIFEGLDFLLEDPQYGRVPGTVESVSETDDTWDFMCVPAISSLSEKIVTLPPTEGTASQILREYLRAGERPWTPLHVEPGLDTEILRLPRREGDLWNLLKQFSAGLSAEISMVDGTVVLRRPRGLITEPGRYFTRALNASTQGTSPGVLLETETLSPPAYDPYSNRSEVYPGALPNDTLPVFSVLGGETAEFTVILPSEAARVDLTEDGGLGEIPVYDDLNNLVGRFIPNSGSVVRERGKTTVREIWSLSPWYRQYLNNNQGLSPGTSSEFSLSVQTIPSADRTVQVEFRAPRVVDSDGRERTFSLAEISGGAQVNGLTFLSFWSMSVGDLRQSSFPTGANLSGDSAFDVVSSKNVAWTSSRISSAGYAAARRASGRFRTLSGTVDRLRPPYEANYYSAAPYEDAQEFLEPRTYGEVVPAYSSVVNPVDYGQVYRYWELNYESSIKTWVFGNVAGARIWDEASNNYYRIRSATITPSSISFSAETDTVHGDVDPRYAGEGLSYEDAQTRHREYVPLSYEQASAVGYLKEPSYA